MAVESPNRAMKDYILAEEEHLSPTVVGATVVLVGTFAVGILYQLFGLVS